jgi:hypothetical protein
MHVYAYAIIIPLIPTPGLVGIISTLLHSRCPYPVGHKQVRRIPARRLMGQDMRGSPAGGASDEPRG